MTTLPFKVKFDKSRDLWKNIILEQFSIIEEQPTKKKLSRIFWTICSLFSNKLSNNAWERDFIQDIYFLSEKMDIFFAKSSGSQKSENVESKYYCQSM